MSKVIFIDPGHGGSDSGASGNGLREKDVTLQVSLELEALLKYDPNYSPVLSRNADVYLSVDSRWQAANNLKAALMVSVHMNSAIGTAGDGFECYPNVPGEAYHAESVRFAELIAKQMSEIQNLRGLNGVRYAYNNGGNILFAESNDKNLKGYRSYYGVVRQTACPAALTEIAFINNPVDIKDFDEAHEWRLVAIRLYLSICAFFGTTAVIAPTVSEGGAEEERPYRVRKSASDAASQIGAFQILSSAKALADKNSGYSVYNKHGLLIYEPVRDRIYTVQSNDSWWKIAQEQIGSGAKMNELAAYNGKTINHTIYKGDSLKIPA